MKKGLFITFLCSFVFYLNISAQDTWTSYEYQTGNTGGSGLIGQYIFSFMPDNQNRLWIGTESGISIKSESGWEWLTINDGLKVNEVGDMAMDQNDNIWIGYGSYMAGVSVYSNEGFTHYSTKDYLVNDKIEDLLVDRDGNVWIATWGGINKFDGSNWESYTIDNGLPTNFILCLAQDEDGNIWIGTGDMGVWMYDGTTFSDNFQETESDERILDIYVDRTNRVWAVSYLKAHIFDGDRWAKINPIEYGVNGLVQKVIEDQNGNFFFATTQGVSLLRDSEWEYFTTDHGLADENNFSLFVDSTNSVYSGSERGYAVFNGETWGATSTEGLISNDVNDIFKDSEGKVWFCTHGGISILDGEKWEFFDKTPNNHEIEWISKGLQDRNGNYWFTTVHGIYKYSLSSGWVIYDYTTSEMFSGWAQDILEDDKGNLWFATFNYLLKYDGTDWTHYTDKDGFRSNYVDAIYQDSNGIIWLGTRGGISYWDGSEFTHDTIKNPRFEGAAVYSFVEDSAGNLIASTSNGLLIFKNGIWDYWNYAPDIWFSDSYKDKNNVLWFASNGGLFKYDGNFFISYSVLDGLVGNVVNGIYREEDTGVFWFATENGVSKLVPGIDAEILSKKSLKESHSIRIETQGITQPFQFSVNGSDFEKNDGIYDNLEAGDYTFTVTNAYDTLTITHSIQDISSGIFDKETADFTIFPNPTKGMINILGDKANRIEVFTLSGQKLLSEKLNEFNHHIDISRYDDGIYILKIWGDDIIHQSKILKKN